MPDGALRELRLPREMAGYDECRHSSRILRTKDAALFLSKEFHLLLSFTRPDPKPSHCREKS